ncbi:uncharacterized protein MT2135-like [Apostichopus japonicus]|uniref:uncharacterized protein MT2135-like n=1 Tax=Stichopus japonicus TaxID=307972 RepID=UPI003AB3CB13
MKSTFHAILLLSLICGYVSYTTGRKLTRRELSFSKDDYLNYVRYYSSHQTSEPLRRFDGNNGKLFLLAKGAEILAGELSKDDKITCHLRQIINVTEVDGNSTYKFTILVEDESDDRTFQAEVLAQLSYSSEGSAIVADIHSIDTTEPLAGVCDQISSLSKCTECINFGRCSKGHVPIDRWLDFALKTQREIQIHKPFPDVQFLAGHNAFNNRADMYGVLDDCKWPPPYNKAWLCLANQELSLTDMLNIGVHALELDPWWCFNKLRLSHAHKRAVGCSPLDRPFFLGIKEIGEWVKDPRNKGKVIRIYFEDGEEHTEGHDDLINGPIQEYVEPFVFTPSDLKETFNGNWPSMGELRKLDKTVIFAGDGNCTHGGKYIHEAYWEQFPVNMFTPYPHCGGRNLSVTRRYYSDSTNYGPFWNGPKKTGVILDFSEYAKCRVGYPAADQLNPVMLRSAIYTWAEGEPSTNLTQSTCIYIGGRDGRWHVAKNCTTSMHSACSRKKHGDVWTISSTKGPSGDQGQCPEGYRFDVPNDGYKRQKLMESMKKQDVWINVKPFLPLLMTENIL